MDMRKIGNLLAHACVVLGTAMLVLWALHIFNPNMQFLTGGPTYVLLLLLSVSSLLLGVVTIGLYRGYQASRHERAVAAARAKRLSGAPLRPPKRQP